MWAIVQTTPKLLQAGLKVADIRSIEVSETLELLQKSNFGMRESGSQSPFRHLCKKSIRGIWESSRSKA
jgi:hypothetical protein